MHAMTSLGDTLGEHSFLNFRHHLLDSFMTPTMFRLLVFAAALLLLSGCGTFGGPAPVYGCWCGKNQPSPGEHPYPVDPWDAACQEHDLCYRSYGRNNPHCDIAFIQRLQATTYQLGYIPGQMQAAYTYFLSRLYGTTSVSATITPIDLATYAQAGSPALCSH